EARSHENGNLVQILVLHERDAGSRSIRQAYHCRARFWLGLSPSGPWLVRPPAWSGDRVAAARLGSLPAALDRSPADAPWSWLLCRNLRRINHALCSPSDAALSAARSLCGSCLPSLSPSPLVQSSPLSRRTAGPRRGSLFGPRQYACQLLQKSHAAIRQLRFIQQAIW